MSRLEIKELIEERPGITAKEIAVAVGIHIQNVYRQIRQLEKTNGYVIVRKHTRYCKYEIIDKSR